MSHVLFLRNVLSVDSGMNTNNFSFAVYVIRFLVTQNMTLNGIITKGLQKEFAMS
jgi:hypothetical protein